MGWIRRLRSTFDRRDAAGTFDEEARFHRIIRPDGELRLEFRVHHVAALELHAIEFEFHLVAAEAEPGAAGLLTLDQSDAVEAAGEADGDDAATKLGHVARILARTFPLGEMRFVELETAIAHIAPPAILETGFVEHRQQFELAQPAERSLTESTILLP